jgi:RES domain-containing protein
MNILGHGANFEGRGRAILESLVLSREIGDDWVNDRPGPLSKRRTAEAVLQVPSVVVPQEWNYLINPESPDFHKILWSQPGPFNIDPRLLWPALR